MVVLMGSTNEASIPFLERTTGEESDYEKPETITNRTFSPTTHRSSQYKWFAFFFLVAFCSILTTFYITVYWYNSRIDETCAVYTSQSRTVVFDNAHLKYATTSFNGSFLKETIYRLPPSPEVDAAWEALGVHYKTIVVPTAEAERSGISLDRLRVGEEYGGPGYPAIVEAIHQLHCLNLLRQSLYFNYDYYRELGTGSFVNKEDALKLHIGHCLDTLRQTLMCAGDTGLVPFLWVGNPPHPFPDFNREHKCRNFEDIRRYAEANQEPKLDDMNVVPHDGALVLDNFP